MKQQDWPRYRGGASAAPSWAAEIRTWCVLHDGVDVAQLEGFDLVVVGQPRHALATWLGPDELERLRARAIRLVAHVPLVRPLASPPPPLRAGAASGLRPAAWYVDAAARIRDATDTAWDGCYLDDVDRVLGFPDGSAAMVELIAIARAAGQGRIVIVQSVTDTAVASEADLLGADTPLA
jgi:hypothetical protein